MRKLFLIPIFILLILGCSGDGAPKGPDSITFRSISPEESNVQFINLLNETENENRFTYEYYYNGAGVGAGDINNDGLPDLYFCGNKSADRLYLNNGDFRFEEISNPAGIINREGWSSGVNFVDINGDHYLDIYVCRSGPSNNPKDRTNQLFINNQNNTFTESAASYGLDITAHSVQSAFFDYDLDGDLDMYLLNHPGQDFKAKDLLSHISEVKSGQLKTDGFYENVDGKFVEKSEEAGLVNFGFRHGIAVGDIDNNGYPDLYISSDFDEPDLLLYNNGDKTFTNRIDEQLRHISNFSMGNEITDINNDGLQDIFVVDMTPDDHVRSKMNMASMNPRKFFTMADNGFHHQYMVNTLQLNRGGGNFSEIAQVSGLSKTDWSWAALFFDMDLDGHRDLFVTNGIKRDILNNDVRINAQEKMKELNRRLSVTELIDMVPQNTISNYVFKNDGDLKFKDVSNKWMDNPNFNSNGAAYADLDNDGDYDLIVNNMDKTSSIYENTSAGSTYNFVKIRLKGPDKNTLAIGSKIKLKAGDLHLFHEVHNARGYLSSTDHSSVFGLSSASKIDTLSIVWPDGTETTKFDLSVNQAYEMDYSAETRSPVAKERTISTLLDRLDADLFNISYRHIENDFDDFASEILLPHRQSRNGPFISQGDVNNDGLEDIYLGGAMGQPGSLYIQQEGGLFQQKATQDFETESYHEDMQSVFFDFDLDGDLDLFVVSGGNDLVGNQNHYQDRIYENDGRGNFRRNRDWFNDPGISGQVVKTSDYDKDGDLDIFVGGRMFPGKYPYPVDSKLLRNDNNKLVDVSQQVASDLHEIGMITGAVFTDFDNDNDEDLILAGEWTEILILENQDGNFKKINLPSLENTTGLWFALEAFDFNQDGMMDYFVGNLGKNTKFKTGGDKSFHIYSKDFDQSGTNDIVLSNNYNGDLVPVRGRECSSEQMPFIKEKYGNFQSFAEASMADIFGEDLNSALHYEADLLTSVVLKNAGNGNFEIIPLPIEAQFSPIMGFEFIDIDYDGENEIIAIGNHYGAEVETVRYDASFGTILKVDSNGFSTMPSLKTGFYTSGDSKDISIIKTRSGQQQIMVTNNNSHIDIFKTSQNLDQ